MTKQKSPLLVRWIISSAFIWLIVFILLIALRFHQDLEYARHNEYAQAHLSEHLSFSVNQALYWSFMIGIILGQAAYWLVELYCFLYSKARKKPYKVLPLPAIIAISLGLIIGFIILTMPLWFHL